MTWSPAPESTNPQNRQSGWIPDSAAKIHFFFYTGTMRCFFLVETSYYGVSLLVPSSK